MWARELEKVDAELVFVGHTHLPLDLTIGNQRLVNPGSVGQPKDGDPRAAFAVFADGEVELKRASYPVEKTIAAFAGSNVDARAIDVLGEMLRKGTPPRMTEL
jgi:diadenosine tetraphosphatase ApaH/serine/threonine PP2A family protein phosphatase